MIDIRVEFKVVCENGHRFYERIVVPLEGDWSFSPCPKCGASRPKSFAEVLPLVARSSPSALCVCGHFDAEHATDTGECTECDCSRLRYTPMTEQTEPTLIDLVQELRRELGLPHGALDMSPKQAWEEAMQRVRRLVALDDPQSRTTND